MKFVINIFLFISLLGDGSINELTRDRSGGTHGYLAYLAHLLQKKTIGDEELVMLLVEIEKTGRVVNPIDPARADTSVDLFLAYGALEELLAAKIDASRVSDWAQANIKDQKRIKKERKLVQEETKLLWRNMPIVLSAAASHTCAIATDGTVKCWGGGFYGETTAPVGVFQSVSAGSVHSCGVSADGTVKCWGSNSDGQSAAPAGVFRSVSAGHKHTCGVRADRTVHCWGNWADRSTDPPGFFQSVSAGNNHNCGVKTNGTVVCWGNGYFPWLEAIPDGIFQSVSAGEDHTCGVKANGTVKCWGKRSDAPAGFFQSVSAGIGTDQTCGVKADGSLLCWADKFPVRPKPPEGVFRSVSLGEWHACGVKTDSTVVCWGSNSMNRLAVPEGLVVSGEKDQ